MRYCSLQPNSLSSAVITLSLIAVAGCVDAPVPTEPRDPSSAILDGAHGTGGNQHFYFLRPLVTPPAAFPGDFDPTYAPEVRICAWNGAACAGGDIAVFSSTPGASGSDIVRIEPADQRYIVNWHTGDYDLDPAITYRIRVLVGGSELGHADVDVVNNGAGLKNVDTDEYIGLVDGRTLPIAFRIEAGALLLSERSVVATGGYHSCAIGADAKTYCWGLNSEGQLGSNVQVFSALPVAVATSQVFTQVVTGFYHSCGLTEIGAAYCWGRGSEGALGNGAFTAKQITPVAVAGGPFSSLTAGAFHTCGLKTDGSAYCWGMNEQGQLGTGTITTAPPLGIAVPTAVSSATSFASLTAGYMHTCGLTSGGAAYCWGNNDFVQLGRGAFSPPSGTPMPVATTLTFVSADAGYFHTCAIGTDTKTYCWGYNGNGELGKGDFFISATPHAVSTAQTFQTVSAGGNHTCALNTQGSAYCWGLGLEGRLGTGNTATFATPQAVPGTDVFAAISAGSHQTCAVTTTGAGRCWGFNNFGQLGTGDQTTYAMPVAVGGNLLFDVP